MLGFFKKIMLYDDRKDKIESLSKIVINTIDTITLNDVKVHVDDMYKYRIYTHYSVNFSTSLSNGLGMYIDSSNSIINKFEYLADGYNLKYKYNFNASVEDKFLYVKNTCAHINRFSNLQDLSIKDIPNVYEQFNIRLYTLLYAYISSNNFEETIFNEISKKHLENTRNYYNSLTLYSLDKRQEMLKDITKRVILESIL